MEYRSSLPYPEIHISHKNENNAKMLLYACAGNVSEETAIHQYLYQSFVLDPTVASILKNIAIVEMHHMELLATMIKQLGIDPKFETQDNVYSIPWTSQYVPYPNSLQEALKKNVQSETLAIANYETIIQYIRDDTVCNVIRRIIEDEKIHLQIFHQLLKKD